jgi:hypothetical protein
MKSEGIIIQERKELIEKINTEARLGNLENIKELCEKINVYSVHACSYAAVNNHYDVVNYFIEKGYGVHGQGLEELIHLNNTTMIKFLSNIKGGLIMSAPSVLENWLKSCKL